MRMTKVYCPVNGWDCPHFRDGECGLDNPYTDCDDFAIFWEEDDAFTVLLDILSSTK